MTESKGNRFGDVLRDIRERSRISRQQLAASSGVPIRTLEKLELSINQPTWDSVWKLCRGLNVSPERFMPAAGGDE